MFEQIVPLFEFFLCLEDVIHKLFDFLVKFPLQLVHRLSNILDISFVELNFLMLKNIPPITNSYVSASPNGILKQPEEIEFLWKLLSHLQDILAFEVQEM